MKEEFWKESGQLFIVIPCFNICSISLIIAGIITSSIPILIAGCIFLLFTLCFLFAPNCALTKVFLSEKGIEIKWFKSQIAFIHWDEITDVKTTPKGRYWNLSLFSKTNRIEIQPTKKILNSIMKLCINPNVKNQIQNDLHLKWFSKQK